RFARAQQRPVEDAVVTAIGPRLAAGGQVEAPGFDAALPVAEGEGEVLHAVLAGGAGAHEPGATPALVAAGADRCLRAHAFEACDALGVGDGAGDLAAVAAGHAHPRAGH